MKALVAVAALGLVVAALVLARRKREPDRLPDGWIGAVDAERMILIQHNAGRHGERGPKGPKPVSQPPGRGRLNRPA